MGQGCAYNIVKSCGFLTKRPDPPATVGTPYLAKMSFQTSILATYSCYSSPKIQAGDRAIRPSSSAAGALGGRGFVPVEAPPEHNMLKLLSWQAPEQPLPERRSQEAAISGSSRYNRGHRRSHPCDSPPCFDLWLRFSRYLSW